MVRRNDGLWQEQITIVVNGHKKQKYFYAKSKREVLHKIADFKSMQKTSELFYVVADAWWRQHETKIVHNTAKQYRPAFNRAVVYFGSKFIREISPSDISQFVWKTALQNNMSQKTAATQLMVINQIFRYAFENGFVTVNPARDVEVPHNLAKKQITLPTKIDIQLAKESYNCTFGMFAYWTMYTGLKRGELLALTWEDVDLINRTITISKTVYHINNRPVLKNLESSQRTLPLLNKLVEKLEPQVGLIFEDPKDGGFITENHFQYLWKEYKSESGVECTPSQLRNSYIMMLAENEIPEAGIQELLGHTQISTTKNLISSFKKMQEKDISKVLTLDF